MLDDIPVAPAVCRVFDSAVIKMRHTTAASLHSVIRSSVASSVLQLAYLTPGVDGVEHRTVRGVPELQRQTETASGSWAIDGRKQWNTKPNH